MEPKNLFFVANNTHFLTELVRIELWSNTVVFIPKFCRTYGGKIILTFATKWEAEEAKNIAEDFLGDYMEIREATFDEDGKIC